MHACDADAVMKNEDNIVTKLLDFSISGNDSMLKGQLVFCNNCSKLKYNDEENGFSRWSNEKDRGNDFFGRSRCICKNEPGAIGRHESFKQRKKNSSTTDVTKSGRNQSTSVKDFIAHNKLLCNVGRVKGTGVMQKMCQFSHLKNTSAYIEQYRLHKLSNIEQSCYQMDQASFDTELFTSLSNSLSMLMRNSLSTTDDQLFNLTKSVSHYTQNPLKVKAGKTESQDSTLNYMFQNAKNGTEKCQSEIFKTFDSCMRCGEALKDQKIIGSLYQSNQDASYVIKATSQDKIQEEKKVKKLTKRTSDQRSKAIIERPLMDSQKQDFDSPLQSDLQPLCQQIPIRGSSLTDKVSNMKKDEWKGHPTSIKPKFSERPSKISSNYIKNREHYDNTGKSLEYTDIFNPYGDKYHLLKEST